MMARKLSTSWKKKGQDFWPWRTPLQENSSQQSAWQHFNPKDQKNLEWIHKPMKDTPKVQDGPHHVTRTPGICVHIRDTEKQSRRPRTTSVSWRKSMGKHLRELSLRGRFTSAWTKNTQPKLVPAFGILFNHITVTHCCSNADHEGASHSSQNTSIHSGPTVGVGNACTFTFMTFWKNLEQHQHTKLLTLSIAHVHKRSATTPLSEVKVYTRQASMKPRKEAIFQIEMGSNQTWMPLWAVLCQNKRRYEDNTMAQMTSHRGKPFFSPIASEMCNQHTKTILHSRKNARDITNIPIDKSQPYIISQTPSASRDMKPELTRMHAMQQDENDFSSNRQDSKSLAENGQPAWRVHLKKRRYAKTESRY